MNRIIEQLALVTSQGLIFYDKGHGEMAEIRDESIEWEDHIDFIYAMYDKNGHRIKEIVNCPVDITFVEGRRMDDED